jgi:prepilin peptidase CpaA
MSGLVGAAIDLRTRRVPNAWTMTAAAVGLAAAASGRANVTTGAALAGLLLGFLLMLPGHMFGGTGGGDVKLLAALGTWLGPSMVFTAFLYSAIAGGVLAVVVAIHRRRINATLRSAARLVAAPTSAGRDIRGAEQNNRFAYAPAIAVGSALAVLGF